ncbi:hypothetical protein AHMF7605_20540 [Adhaeribacter arboris]|uniref:Uncharacterized protein n=1 Tax=Adhaeribacter arboris TaxID=2072846 RepID=A0A2T2YJP3_9BACT|nr:hypothetical protein AHMF7605_20540 [Adhaeribacter arboris]
MLRTTFKVTFLFLLFINYLTADAQSGSRNRNSRSALPLPKLVSENGKHTLLVDGKSYLFEVF